VGSRPTGLYLGAFMNLAWGCSMIMPRNRVLALCLIVVVLTGGILSGCGMKGPLYFPEEEQDKDKRADSQSRVPMPS